MPTFIKTGFWDKLSRAPKEYLNLDLLLSTALPSQLGNNGKYLQTDGSTASWQTISLTGYVPYTGATGPVNLGTYDLTVNGLTVGRGANNIGTNTALGIASLANVTIATNTVGIGYNSLQSLTTGNFNTALGSRSLYLNQIGIGSTAIGIYSLYNATGDYNTALGASSGQSLTTGTYNTFIGKQAGFGVLSGSKNIIISSRTSMGSGITTGSYNTIIGNEISGLDATTSNNIILADGQGNIRFRAFDTGNVSINSNTDIASAQFSITSTTKGFLPPRMTTTEKNAIASPAAGLVVYDTTTNRLCCFNGTIWNDLF